MLSPHELIVAPATVSGSGSRGVVRLSGDGLDRLLKTLFIPTAADFPQANQRPRLVAARLSPAGLNAEWAALPVEILYWPGPAGPTGGPLAEVQLPASGPLIDAVVAAACQHGARLARGGEFSLRSFLAGRLDLLQAEAVLAVVEAQTPGELSAALDMFAGGMGRLLHALREQLLDLTADVEAAIDFADEHTPDAVPVADARAWAAIETRLVTVIRELDAIAARLVSRNATAAADLPRVVLAGPPNIGKSSLFNALVGRDAALVANESGTTRDWITARLDTGPVDPACLLIDIAGLAERAMDTATATPIDQRVAERANAEVLRADVLVVCSDAAANAPVSLPRLPPDTPQIKVMTRCDLAAVPQEEKLPGSAFCTSSRTGLGLGELRTALLRAVANLPRGRSPATLRMLAGIAIAQQAVKAAEAEAGRAGGSRDEAIVAGLLHQAVAAVADVTGVEIGTELIDRIFSRHCIGK